MTSTTTRSEPAVVLTEYRSTEVSIDPAVAAALHATGKVTVTPMRTGRWLLTASSYVGTLVVGDFHLLVRPKIPLENLFLMLETGLDDHSWRRELFDYGTATDLVPALIAFFTRTVDHALGRGVLRSYVPQREPLVTLRGRVDVTAQMRRAGMASPVACMYDDHVEDVCENRVLRAALRAALRAPGVQVADRRRMMRHLAALGEVCDVPVTPPMIDRITFDRLNAHYRPAIGLARLILADMTVLDGAGSTVAPSFMIDMNAVFQRFVTARLRAALSGRLRVIDEQIVPLAHGRQVSMRPDLLLRRGPDGADYVGDIKYKISTEARGVSADYYQLLAYTTALGLDEGILIYCRDPDARDERTITVRNADTRLVLHALDLSGSADRVDTQIRILADTIAAGARRA